MRQSHAWRQAGPRISIAVNLSARNLRDAKLLEKIKGLVLTWGIDLDCGHAGTGNQ
jgi:EAL domain-containing protein (putative c-di-GMP-specific phosphodiesterase class I)